MPSHPSYADVAVFAALPGLLTYRIPKALLDQASPGRRVVVPLGTRKARGIIIGRAGKPPAGIKPREILELWDAEPVLPEDLLELGAWISAYYFAPPGEVFRSMLPLQAETRERWTLQITPKGRERFETLSSQLVREGDRETEAQVLRILSKGSGVDAERLQRQVKGVTKPLLLKWDRAGLLESQREEVARKTREMAWYGLPSSPPPLPNRISPAAKRILEHLKDINAPVAQAVLLKSTRAKLSHLKQLQAEGLVLACDKPPTSGPKDGEEDPEVIEQLTPAQGKVFDRIESRLVENRFRVMLLHGVTGSGKTEIYLRSIQRVLAQGRSALILVPEIALTPAVQMLFAARFPGVVALLHSGLRDRERQREWWRVRRGEARLVVGTRSAALAPVRDLGLVVVDEEHDASYKQQKEPRYHGRDVAIMRARRQGVPVLLGSATPALESYWNAAQGKYELVELPERIAGRPMASVEVLDMRAEFKKTRSAAPISERLINELEVELNRKSQAMILVNRRGYAWFLLCRSCGRSEGCRNCSISLTYHQRDRRLMCHYCGYQSRVPKLCTSCGSEYLHFVGAGTERLMELLQSRFPEARIGRLDRDVAQRRDEYRRVLSRFKQRRLDLLVGTQMIAKGHDFPGLTLVGVVAADAALSFPDFRAAERVFQLLTQSAGRAGRAAEPGRVLIQTFYPEHYAVQTAARQDYRAFYEKEIRFRRMMHYPPFTALANLVLRHPIQEKATQLAARLRRYLGPLCEASSGLRLLGPGPAPLARLHNQYRMQFVLKAANRKVLNVVLGRLFGFLSAERWPRKTLVIDVDPVDLM